VNREESEERKREKKREKALSRMQNSGLEVIKTVSSFLRDNVGLNGMKVKYV